MSDDFDCFDNDGLDFNALDAIEQEAIKSTQAPPKARVTTKYHHTVAQPKAGPSRPAPTFGGRKAPAPLNTEPGTKVTGFGWEEGGKRSMDGNVDRYLAGVQERQRYWGQNDSRDSAAPDEESFPSVVLKEDGYAYAEKEAEVVDSHSRTGLQLPSSQNSGAAARRAAIAASMGNGKPAAGATPVNGQVAPKFPTNRTLSRSVSVGNHTMNRSVSRPPGAGLSPILSQGGSQSPQLQPSQGAVARKTAFELEDERQKRAAVEAELAKVKQQLAQQSRSTSEASKRTLSTDAETQVKAGPSEDFTGLKSELYKAKGEAATIRRAQKDEQARHLAEADKLRAQIADMEQRLVEREKEAARQVENVRTQAVFANHAAHNSAIRNRAASQRPMATPMRGSPKGRNGDQAQMHTSLKGKEVAMLPPPPPAPRFGALNNAFSADLAGSKVKRQRTESVFPEPDPSPTKPRSSPRRAPVLDDDGAGPSSPSPMDDDVDTGADAHAPGLDDAANELPLAPPVVDDQRSELLHLIFNHKPLAPFQAWIDKEAHFQPAIYRILNYRPSKDIDPGGSYARYCTELLQACGDSSLTLHGLAEVLVKSAMKMVRLLLPTIQTLDSLTNAEVATIINVMSILGQAAWLFPQFVSVFVATDPSGTQTLQALVNSVFGTEEIANIQDTLDIPLKPPEVVKEAGDEASQYYPTYMQQDKEPTPPPTPLDPRRTKWVFELGTAIGTLAQAICWRNRGLDAWSGEELVDIALGLTGNHLEIAVVLTGADLIWTAAVEKDNFRSAMVQTPRTKDQQPLIQRISRYLISPKIAGTPVQLFQLVISLVTALRQLSMSSPDAVLLVGQKSLVVPALITVLRRESSKVWGVYPDEYDMTQCMNIIFASLSLLHHLIYPRFVVSMDGPTPGYPISSFAYAGIEPDDMEPSPPEEGEQGTQGQASQSVDKDLPQGINFVERLRTLGLTREFHGLGHIFITCIGTISYAQPVDDVEDIAGIDLAHIQEMAQDVLEAVVEGPEEDAVYGLYADEEEDMEVEDDSGPEKAAAKQGEDVSMDGDEGVDGDVLHAIVISDDDD